MQSCKPSWKQEVAGKDARGQGQYLKYSSMHVPRRASLVSAVFSAPLRHGPAHRFVPSHQISMTPQ